MKNLRFDYSKLFLSIAMEVILLVSIFATIISVSYAIAEPPEPPIWWDDMWPFRKAVTFDHAKVAGDLFDFPVLIDIVDADLAEKAKSDGEDIAFTDNAGNKISHEIEYYDSSTGHLFAWVKIPILSSTEDTTIYMYYGNPDAFEQSEPYDVWDTSANCAMVQHLSELSGIRYDSSFYGNDGVVSGVVQGVAGQIDGADVFDGSTGFVTVPHNDVLTGFNSAFTVSLWVKLDTVSRRQTLLCKYDTSGNQRGWMVEYRNSEKAFAFFASRDGASFSWWYAKFTPKANTWYYLSIVWESGKIPTFYIDGQQVPTTLTGTVTQIYDNSGTPLYIGKCAYSTAYNLDGTLDEIRLSNATRTPEWILTSYNNQKNPSTFYTLGNEEPNV